MRFKIQNLIRGIWQRTSLLPGSKAFSISARTSMIPRAFWISVKLTNQQPSVSWLIISTPKDKSTYDNKSVTGGRFTCKIKNYQKNRTQRIYEFFGLMKKHRFYMLLSGKGIKNSPVYVRRMHGTYIKGPHFQWTNSTKAESLVNSKEIYSMKAIRNSTPNFKVSTTTKRTIEVTFNK